MKKTSSFQQQQAAWISTDILGYLRQHELKDMLRFLTCGSVDDGKSTLIGRLLYDSKMIYEDQLAAVMKDSKVHGTTGDDFDPALLTDGLKAEREQGITIDVAYRYFSTDKRNFIICDAPGHEQYTRNMATGASHCELAIVLIDARNGVMPQTKRHSFIATLLGIKHLVVCINKMDAVGYDETIYRRIRREYEGFAAKLDVADIHFLPISALKGDNVVEPGTNMPWFKGEPLLSYLENVQIASDRNLIDFRFPVQYVLRPNLDFRGFCGTIASGIVRKGDDIAIMPSGKRTRIASVLTFDGEIDEAFAPMAVTVTTTDEVDTSRGDMMVHINNLPQVGNDFEAMLVWMSEKPLTPGAQYVLKTTSNMVPASVDRIRYQFDINTLKRHPTDALPMNGIGRAAISTHRPICFDSYSRNRNTGGFVLIDRVTNATLAAGMILDREPNAIVPDKPRHEEPVSHFIRSHRSLVTAAERERRLNQRARTIWLTGLPKSGKSTIAYALERRLFDSGSQAVVLDGENLRATVSADLGFSADDRREHVRRAAAAARLLNDAGIIAIVALLSPYADDRAAARRLIESVPGTADGDGPTAPSRRFVEVLVDCPIAVCRQRDTDGLYEKADRGEIEHFSGVTAPYEAPRHPDITLKTAESDVAACVAQLIRRLAPPTDLASVESKTV